MRSNEGKAIILLDEAGYKLAARQADLTPSQEYILLKGYMHLQEERNKAIEESMNR